jgi:pyruvate/2-oxoglutarate dehydrogenase complex dihydrolipoamide dehydrogenase (E3) component
MENVYDLAIIGGGAAGLIAAPFAVQLGARVAFIEKDRIGGDCTWTGCVPSKTLIKSARVAYQMRTANRFGLTPVDTTVDLKPVMEHIRTVIAEIYSHTTPETLHDQGIDVFMGEPHFIDPHTISIGDQTLSANYMLICTGAHPFVPPITGLDATSHLTYQNIWDLNVLPNHLVVIGGGPIGCEIAQGFRRLGSRVTLIEGGDRLLPHDDHDASRTLAEVFINEGIDLRLQSTVERTCQIGSDVHLATESKEIVGDALLVAVGRRPNLDGLFLEKAGVKYSKQGIQVDKNLRTSQHHIYAAGDCLGGFQFSHYAGWQGFIAVRNALLPGSSRGITDQVPWTTFTDPEVAHVGMTEEQARQKLGDDVFTTIWPMKSVDRALNEAEDMGFIKLIYQKDRKLIGVTIVAAEAGEMVNEWVIAMKHNFKVDELASVIHVYPTYSTGSMQASAAILVKRLLGGLSGEIVRRLAHIKH